MSALGIPDDVLALCEFGSRPPDRWEVTTYTCTLWFCGIECRFKLTVNDEWVWDEIVGKCWLHIEQMSESFYWLSIHPLDGEGNESDLRVCVDIGSRSGRAAVQMAGWVDP